MDRAQPLTRFLPYVAVGFGIALAYSGWMGARGDTEAGIVEAVEGALQQTSTFDEFADGAVTAGLRFQPAGLPSDAVEAVTFDDGRFLVAGVVSDGPDRTIELRSSVDGRTWDRLAVNVDDDPESLGSVSGVAADGDRIVLAVDRFLPDGTDRLGWARRNDLLVSDDAGATWQWSDPNPVLHRSPESALVSNHGYLRDIGFFDGALYSAWTTSVRFDLRAEVGDDPVLGPLAECLHDTPACPEGTFIDEVEAELLAADLGLPTEVEALLRRSSEGVVLRSEDAVTWERVDLGVDLLEIDGFATGPAGLALTAFGRSYYDPLVLRSDDGADWLARPVPDQIEWAEGIGFQGDGLMMTGPGFDENYPILTSSDGGATWTTLIGPGEEYYLTTQALATGGAGTVASAFHNLQLDDGTSVSTHPVLFQPEPGASWIDGPPLRMVGQPGRVSYVAGDDRFLALARGETIGPGRADGDDYNDVRHRTEPTIADYDELRGRVHVTAFVVTPEL